MEKDVVQSSQCSEDYNQEKLESIFLKSNIESNLPSSIINGSQLIDMKIEEIPKLYEFFPMIGLWFLAGASDTGKSMFLRQLALSVSGRKDFLGNQFNGKYGRALYISTEDDEMSIAFLVRQQNNSLKLSKDELENFLCTTDSDDIKVTLDSVLETSPVDLVVLDAFGDLFTGKDLNQNNQVRQFLQPFSEIAIKHKCSVCFLHHTGKRTEELAPNKNNVIGSQAIEAKSRCVIEFRKDCSNLDFRHLCIVKANYLPESEKGASHVLRMDENLCFHTTGNRVDFDKLKLSNNESNGKPDHAKPTSYEDKTHIQFLKEIYKDTTTVYTGAKLKEQIRIRFKCSDQPSRNFLEYYVAKEWIKNIAPSSSNSHKYMLVPKQINISF